MIHFLRVLEGIYDVVDVHAHPSQPRDTSKEMIHVAAHLHDVPGVDEQDVVLHSRARNGSSVTSWTRWARIFTRPTSSGLRSDSSRSGLGLDEGEVHVTFHSQLNGVQHDTRRVPGTNFDDSPRGRMPKKWIPYKKMASE